VDVVLAMVDALEAHLWRAGIWRHRYRQAAMEPDCLLSRRFGARFAEYPKWEIIELNTGAMVAQLHLCKPVLAFACRI